jgi:glycosyltransferase involved in cell wall biosynthesis
MPGKEPEVSIVIPAYRSEETIARSLSTMLSQEFNDYEVVVVDSSPDNHTEEIVRGRYPTILYHHHSRRLLPHAARNRGVELARGRLLVFTDPDVYAPANWLAALVAAYQKHEGVIAGAISCFGRRYVDVGLHHCKFDSWLPGGGERRFEVAATANMLCNRTAFENVGGFNEVSMLSDTLMSWALAKKSIPIWFIPDACVEHHHIGTWKSLLRERYLRGKEFAHLRLAWNGWSGTRIVCQAAVSLIPLRLAKLTWRGMTNARRAGTLTEYLKVAPVVVSGQAAWLAGEAVAYSDWLRGLRETF